MIDVITPDGVAVDIKDAVAEVAKSGNPELIGMLVQILVHAKILDAQDLAYLLPLKYEVRED